jgi:hypothetical protein
MATPRDHPDRTRPRWREGLGVGTEGSVAEGADEGVGQGMWEMRWQMITTYPKQDVDLWRRASPSARPIFRRPGCRHAAERSTVHIAKGGPSWPDMSTHPGM